MARRIGLSLGADLCWPAAFEAIAKSLDIDKRFGEDVGNVLIERVRVHPFSLTEPNEYDLVLDRVTHWFPTTREWMKKIMLEGTYVFNDPWSIQACEKHTSYVAMAKLGLPVPKTWLLPPKEYPKTDDFPALTSRYNDLFSLKQVGEEVGYPAFLKPYDGGAWVGVSKVDDARELQKAYDGSGERVMHLQQAVDGFDLFVRSLGVGPQVNNLKYNPAAPLHARYEVDFNFVDSAEWLRLQRQVRTINAFFNWDFNSCESLRKGGVFHPIDFANAMPDSQVTSLHFYWPWLVKALLRWSLFNAVERRSKTLGRNWQAYYDAHDPDATLDENLEAYDKINNAHFETDRFEAFCAEHLPDFDEMSLAWFESPACKEVIRAKVAALFPAHEVEEFTDHYWGLVRFWTDCERKAQGTAG